MPWSGGKAPHILNLGARWRWADSFALRLLYAPKKEPLVPIGQTAGLVPDLALTLWRWEKSLSLPGVEPRFFCRPSRLGIYGTRCIITSHMYPNLSSQGCPRHCATHINSSVLWRKCCYLFQMTESARYNNYMSSTGKVDIQLQKNWFMVVHDPGYLIPLRKRILQHSVYWSANNSKIFIMYSRRTRVIENSNSYVSETHLKRT
jgi:hypothetical protein